MGKKSNRSLEVRRWMTEDDCGISSRCLAFTAIGLRRKLDWTSQEPPSDPADLGRCLRLLRRLPWIRAAAFPTLRRKKEWKKVIKNWDKLAALMEEEVGIDWSKGHSAKRTYEAMKKIGL